MRSRAEIKISFDRRFIPIYPTLLNPYACEGNAFKGHNDDTSVGVIFATPFHMVDYTFCIYFLCSSVKALDDPYASMREVHGGKFKIGVNDPRSKTGEYPPREVKVRDFFIDLYPVTVSQFRWVVIFILFVLFGWPNVTIVQFSLLWFDLISWF